jgi:hypothetical protein
MIRKAVDPVTQYWRSLPSWAKNGPLGIVFALVCWAAVLLFIDFRMERTAEQEMQRNAILRQTAAIQQLAEDRREQTRLLSEIVRLLEEPGHEKWGEIRNVVRKLETRKPTDEEIDSAVQDWKAQTFDGQTTKGDRSLGKPSGD